MSKLTGKLIVMFGAVILTYAVILVYNFSHFTNDVLNSHHVEVILSGAENVAETLERRLPQDITESTFIEQVKKSISIDLGLEMVQDISSYSYSLCGRQGDYLYLNDEILYQKTDLDLIEEARAVYEKAFSGESSCIEVLTEEGHIIVGAAPVHNASSQVVGIILILHQANDSLLMQSKINHFLFNLTGLALLLLLLVSILLSSRFTAPIRKITYLAKELTNGNLDIRTEIHQNDEIGELASSMDQLASELRKSKEIQENEIKIHDKFLAEISHELKTPVTVMRGSLESLVDGVIKNPEDVAAYHQQMLTESKVLQKLIQDLLMISTLKTKEFKIKQETILLSDLMSDTAMSARSMAMSKKVELITQPPAENTMIEGDYELLRKLLMVILDNAIKYTEAGKRVFFYQKGPETIVIQDEGRGIRAEDLPHIFDRFYRQNKHFEPGSSGLGLAIAKEIAHRHGIKIRVESTVHVGTTFTLIFKTVNQENE